MNQVLSLLQASRSLAAPQPALQSDHLIAELISLHGDMIEQLRLEQLCSPGKSAFLTLLIEQHEKTAALLRARIESRRPESNTAAVLNALSPSPPIALPHHHRSLYFAAASLRGSPGGSAAPPHGHST